MKKILKFALILGVLMSGFFIIDVDAKTTYTGTVNDSAGVYLRKGPGTNYDYIVLLNNKETIDLVNNTKINGNSDCKYWYQVNYKNNTNAYVCGEYINVSVINNDKNYYTTTNWGTRINEDYATVRKTASSNGDKIEIIYLGTDVKVLSTTGDWAKISYYNGKTGYVLKRLVSNYDDVTKSDEEYTKILKEEGFPDSYIPFLTYLHEKHPTWIFKADILNKTFDNAVNNEAGKNKIQTNQDLYRTSNVVKENPNWYIASYPVVAFMLDPRNYLTETNIFAFEKLTYDKTTQTEEVIKKLFKGSYLEKDPYPSYFVKAAETYNVSPVHLAARVNQEGGTTSTYAAVSGTATSVSGLKYRGHNLDGYYNYYNIGAYEDDYTDSSVTRGLATAAGIVDNNDGTPWDSREKAIIYGASFIADGYIDSGQDTLYYQKFNVANNTYFSSYTHQYMSNIIAPSSESLATFESYRDAGIINSSFTFVIPVYKSMPSEFTKHPVFQDTNNELTDIKIDGTSLTGFDSDVLDYQVYVDSKVNEINLTATAKSSKATINGTGKITLNNEETVKQITVTSESGSVKKYQVTIIKTSKTEQENENDENNKSIEEILKDVDVKINDDYMTGIGEKVLPTTLSNMIKKQYPNITVTITDKNNETKSDNLKTGDKITITNGESTKTYTIVIKGDVNSDGVINVKDLVRLQRHILKYITLTDAEAEAGNTNYENNIDVKDLVRLQRHILKYIVLK